MEDKEFNLEEASYRELQVETTKRGLGSGVGKSAVELRSLLSGEKTLDEVKQEILAAIEEDEKCYHVFTSRGDLHSYMVGTEAAKQVASLMGGFVKEVK